MTEDRKMIQDLNMLKYRLVNISEQYEVDGSYDDAVGFTSSMISLKRLDNEVWTIKLIQEERNGKYTVIIMTEEEKIVSKRPITGHGKCKKCGFERTFNLDKCRPKARVIFPDGRIKEFNDVKTSSNKVVWVCGCGNWNVVEP